MHQSCTVGKSSCHVPLWKSVSLAFMICYQEFSYTCEVAGVWVQKHSTRWPLPWRLLTSRVGEEIWSARRRKTLCRNRWKNIACALSPFVFSCCGIRKMENMCNVQCWPCLAPWAALIGCRCCHSGLRLCVYIHVHTSWWGRIWCRKKIENI